MVKHVIKSIDTYFCLNCDDYVQHKEDIFNDGWSLFDGAGYLRRDILGKKEHVKQGGQTHNIIVTLMVEDPTALHFPVRTVDGCSSNFCLQYFILFYM